MKISQLTQDYTISNLPDGARARFGKGTINDIQFSPDGTQLAVASSIGIWIYDIKTYQESVLFTGHTSSVSSIAYSPNGRFLASGDKDNTVQLWDPKHNVHLKTLQIFAFQPHGVYSVVFQGDRRIYASGGCTDVIWKDSVVHSEERSVFLWETELDLPEIERDWWTIEHDVPVKSILQHKGVTESIVFGGDGALLASGSEDGTVRLWDAESGALLKTLQALKKGRLWGTENVESLAFSRDGHLLASGQSGNVCLWDVERGELLKTLNAHLLTGGAYGICFSLDGHILASSSGFNGICLWDVSTGKRLKTLAGHNYSVNNHVTSLAFSPDGCTLASGSQDGTVLLWDIEDITDDKSTPATRSTAPPIPTGNIITDKDIAISTEERTEPQNREYRIQQICTERSITTLFHFTRIENLRTILQEGLLGRSILETWEQQPLFNDSDRADGYKEVVCLSISFPNYKMFWDIRKKKEKTEGVKDFQWIVLLLDARALWELDCAFCYTNAASGVVKPLLSKEQIDEQKRPEALKNMFAEDYYDSIRKISINRQSLQIPDNYTTDPQAEILVFDSIPTGHIKEIHFYEEIAREEWFSNAEEAYSQTFRFSREYFNGRDDWQFWQKKAS